MKRILLLLSIVLLTSCGNSKNSKEFMDAVSGNYLFNSDESIGITFVEGKLNVRWRGKVNIEPLKVNDSTFYIQEMNEKFIFVMQPKVHILLAKKREHDGKTYTFSKMAEGEKTAREYLLNGEYKKALTGYQMIQKNDSLDRTIRERTFNKLGYEALKNKNYKKAVEIFTINTKLYPNSSNTYDSLGEAYWYLKDTLKTKENFKKALSINPENRNVLRFVKKHQLEVDK
jgi:tetratricopeptide (TPR) repeat protein